MNLNYNIWFEVMRLQQSSKPAEFIQTFLRIKPIAIDELSSINSTKHEVTVNRANS